MSESTMSESPMSESPMSESSAVSTKLLGCRSLVPKSSMEFLTVSKTFTVSESTTEMFPVSKAAMMTPESHSMSESTMSESTTKATTVTHSMVSPEPDASESTASVLRRLSQNSCHGEHQDDDCQAIHCVVLCSN